MIERVLGMLVAFAGCVYRWPDPPHILETTFADVEVTGDCETMKDRVADGAWSLVLHQDGRPDVVLYASDQAWVIKMYEVPPSRRADLGFNRLSLECAGERLALRPVVCRHELRGMLLYVDRAQLAGWERRGSTTAGCRLTADIEGELHRDDRTIVLRPGIHDWVRAEDPGPYPVSTKH
jgi:hypothetical protein